MGPCSDQDRPPFSSICRRKTFFKGCPGDQDRGLEAGPQTRRRTGLGQPAHPRVPRRGRSGTISSSKSGATPCAVLRRTGPGLQGRPRTVTGNLPGGCRGLSLDRLADLIRSPRIDSFRSILGLSGQSFEAGSRSLGPGSASSRLTSWDPAWARSRSSFRDVWKGSEASGRRLPRAPWAAAERGQTDFGGWPREARTVTADELRAGRRNG